MPYEPPYLVRLRTSMKIALYSMTLTVATLALLLVVGGGAAHAAFPVVTVHPSETYITRGQLPLKGDAYVSSKWRMRPTILVIHGGGWNNGSRADERRRALMFARAGFSVFNIDYRLSCRYGETIKRAQADPNSRVVYPFNSPRRYQYCAGANMTDMQSDVSEALRYMYNHRFVWRMDMSRVSTFGGSAGGHLALQATEPQPKGVPAVGAAVAWSGPSDLMRTRRDGSRVLHAIEKAIGCRDIDCPSAWRLASPQFMLKWASRTTNMRMPRMLLFGSKGDPVVKWRDTYSMFRTMRALRSDVTMYTVARPCHGANCSSYIPARQRLSVRQLTLDWLIRTQRP